ncbi:MAG: hypothetical protein HOV80_33730 [Polyangiaceae bacterium]|nr:hypothetical protein [Polyangiaceae bacterium]
MYTGSLRSLGFALTLAVSSLVVGCDDGVQTGDEQEQNEFLIDGVPAAEFYEEFIYERVKPLEHYYPSTWNDVPLPDTNRSVSLSLYMREDGTYTADYVELAPWSGGGMVHEVEKQLSGKWHVAKTELILDGLGVAQGEGKISDNSLSLSLTFDRDIETAGLKGQEATLRIVRSTWGPDGNEE